MVATSTCRNSRAAARLFLPVNVPGALFFTGNGHALQGNGEITNPSLEVSLTGYFEFIVHKNHPSKMPRVETPTHYIFLGMHNSLDEAVRQATFETVEFVQKKGTAGFLRRLCADQCRRRFHGRARVAACADGLFVPAQARFQRQRTVLVPGASSYQVLMRADQMLIPISITTDTTL